MAGAGNYLGVGAVPRVSIDSLHRSFDRCGCLPVEPEGGDEQLNRNIPVSITANPTPKKGMVGTASLKVPQLSDD
jgi:hypothetical protein